MGFDKMGADRILFPPLRQTLNVLFKTIFCQAIFEEGSWNFYRIAANRIKIRRLNIKIHDNL